MCEVISYTPQGERIFRCKFCWPENILYLFIEGPHKPRKSHTKKDFSHFFEGEMP